MPAILKGELVRPAYLSFVLSHRNTTIALSASSWKRSKSTTNINTVGMVSSGWVDRVYAGGFAYWVGEYTPTRQSDRFGEGNMAGKRAMCMVRFYICFTLRLMPLCPSTACEKDRHIDLGKFLTGSQQISAGHAPCMLQTHSWFFLEGHYHIGLPRNRNFMQHVTLLWRVLAGNSRRQGR